VVWSLMGDLDYYAKTLGLPRSTSSSPCFLCRCTLRGESSWRDNSSGAPWLNLCWTPAAWKAWPERSQCKLFDVPGITACTVAPDWMHAKYLRCDQYIYGTILYLLCFQILQKSPLENLQFCWAYIKTFYSLNETKYRFQNIGKLSMFIRKNNTLKLRGKAGELKGICGAILSLWESNMNTSLEVHQKILLLLKLNVMIETMMTNFSHLISFPSDKVELFRRYVFAWAQSQVELSQYFAEQNVGKTLFTVTSKMHQVVHCAKNAQFLNPSLVWCFIGEDFMRRVQKLGEASVRGNNGAQAVSKMMQHYRLAMHLQFLKH